MITVSLIGRLGNHMFQYAAGKVLAERHGFAASAGSRNCRAGRARGDVTAPIFLATASVCGMADVEATIRSAQEFLPDHGIGIFAGPDTDEIDYNRRFDQCHFDLAGQEQHALLWTATLANYDKKPIDILPPGLCTMEIFRRSSKENYRLVWNVTSGKNPVLDHGIGSLPALSGAIVLDKPSADRYSMSITAPDGTPAQCVARPRDR